ncbi:hypothetical protein [Streptomyces sp. NPDC020141]|uniref:hypothetical protein n=1 Tax=Streptomyces sp. NPDC020141 TaxID=3365065 RepID=UPI00378D140F
MALSGAGSGTGRAGERRGGERRPEAGGARGSGGTGGSGEGRRTSAVARGGRLSGRILAVLLSLAALGAVGPGGAEANAAPAVCSGRPDKVLEFATGELRVYKKHRYACAVTVAKNPGARRSMYVSLQPRGGHPRVDEGRFTHRAGPVTVHALHRCVRASGKVSGVGRSTGWILC